MAAAADELLLLERVFLRIGSAESDEQLQNAVSKFLPPVLLKLSSQQEGVRKKVMELLVHINKRIKSRPLVQLPVEALLLQYQDPAASSFVINFTIIYIKLGFPRLPTEKQAELVPSVLNALEAKPQSHQDSLLMLIIPILGQVPVPADPQKRASLFGLNEKPHVAKQLASIMLDMLLLPYGATASSPESSTNPSSSTTFPTPPGMSPYTFKRVTGGADGPSVPHRPEQLEQIKLGIVRFLAGGVYSDHDILVHLVVAAADTRFSVANLADLELKKIVGGLDWGCATLVTPLYRLYLGSQGNVKPEHKKLPASTRIRLKLLYYLCRVTGAGFVLPPCIQVVFDSLYGANTNAKLKSLALTFTTNIIQQADKTALEPVGRLLLCGLTKLTEESEGPPQAQAYSIIGLLGRRLPSLVVNDFSLLENLFKKLVSEPADVKMQVREGLLNLVSAYRESPEAGDADSRLMLLMSLLRQYVDDDEPMVRFVAVKFIAAIFPPNHVESKYLLLLATGDSKDDVSTEAMKSLYGTIRKQNAEAVENETVPLKLPLFNEFMHFVHKETNSRLQKPSKCYTQGNHTLPYNPTVYKEIIVYIRLCLLQNVDINHTCEVMRHPNDSTPVIAKYLANFYNENDTSVEKNHLVQYLLFSKRLLRVQPTVETICCILEIVGCLPSTHKFLLDDLKFLRDLLNSTREEIREYGSVLYGIIIANGLPDNNEFNNAIEDLLHGTENNKYLETQHGCILGAANSLERKMVVTAIKDEKFEQIYEKTVRVLIEFLKIDTAILVGGSCIGLGLLGSCASLPLDANTKLEIVDQLLKIMNNVKLPSRVRERSIRTLGLICSGDLQFPHVGYVLEHLVDNVNEFRDLELQLAVGDALVLCVNTRSKRDPWSAVQIQDEVSVDERDENLQNLISRLLRVVAHTQPYGRQTSAVWLLALLKNCSGRDVLKSRMQDVQAAFMDLLGENNEIVVDIASKALGIIYEKSEASLGGVLLEQLVVQLQAGRRTVAPVTGDTKLFENDEIGRAPDGGRLGTYQELCSLASDLNKPDLIYQFMQIANHNSVWNSRKAAGFGFAAVATHAGQKLKPFLPQIVPRLYRYQFDPQPQMQVPMQKLWKALVEDPPKIIFELREEILNDLVHNLTANQWRVRHSSCAALADFFRVVGIRGTLENPTVWPQIWHELFRVMDDVHEQTRLMAASTASQLSKLCIRSCDPAHAPASGARLLQALLPVFLEEGIVNTVPEVRAVALQTVSQLVNAAGAQLKPHLPLLIPALLQAAGELESTKLSYVSTMFSANTATQEAIDSVRASAAKSHYTTETVTKCLQYIDNQTLETLLPRVLDLMKSSPGLGTRVASTHFLSLLTLHLGAQMAPHAGRALSVLLTGLGDRNAAIRKCYAAALGHLVAVAKDSSVEKVFGKLKTWYFEREDAGTRAACAYAVQAIANHAQDTLKKNEDVVIPLVFFAMHADKTPENEHTVEIWNEIWSENTPGTESGIRQNIETISSMLQTALESPSWTMKAQAANAIAMVATKLGAGLESRHRNQLLNILVSGLSGRTWNGKEKLLKALACVCSSCKESIKTDPEVKLEVVVDALMKECRKDDLNYKRMAIEATGETLAALELDRFEELYNIVQNILSKDTMETSDDEDLSMEETSTKRENTIKLKETIYETLGKAWPANNETQEKYGELFVTHCAECLPNSTRAVQVSVVAALCQYVDKLAVLHSDNVTEINEQRFSNILGHILQAVLYALSISKHTRLRKEALNVLLSLTRGLKDKNRTADYENLRTKFNEILPSIEKDHQPEIKTRLADLKILFQTN